MLDYVDFFLLVSFYCNDMVVDFWGWVYVGNFGFDLWNNVEFKFVEIVFVELDG